MKDLNFFESYIEKKEFKFDKIFILYILFIIIFVYVSFTAIYNKVQISKLRAEISEKIVIAEEPKAVNKVKEIKELENEVKVFREEVDRIINLDEIIEESDKIGEGILKSIKSKMPADLFMRSFSAYSNEIQISGMAKDTYTIAEFAKGLGEIEEVDDIFLSNIVSEEAYYSFNLTLRLEDVTDDGNQVIEDQ